MCEANKRIGLAINYDYHDYGGMLQAYATYRKLKELGYQPEAINIDNLKKSINKRKMGYFARNILDSSIVKEKGEVVKKKIRRKLDRSLGVQLDKRDAAFEQFCRSHFKESEAYESWEKLTEGCRSYNAVLVGSDQLWLPSNIAGDYYTLSFVPSEVNKIAYATSFGVSEIPKCQHQDAKRYLSRINHLSAREDSGKKLIRKFTGRDVPLVCDPTMLLTAEEWAVDVQEKRLIKEKYIFCYFMGDNPWQRAFVRRLKKRTGYKIVALLHLDQFIKSDEEYADETPFDVSPTDFINLIKNAEFVCTDSFHGTVFSIIHKRPFFTFRRFSETATLSTNTRIYSLLKRFCLEERLVKQEYDISSFLQKSIDYDKVHQILDRFREESTKYLLDGLSE